MARGTQAPEAVFATLGLKPTGRPCLAGEPPFGGGALDGGWYLLVANRDLRFVEQPPAGLGGELLGGSVSI